MTLQTGTHLMPKANQARVNQIEHAPFVASLTATGMLLTLMLLLLISSAIVGHATADQSGSPRPLRSQAIEHNNAQPA